MESILKLEGVSKSYSKQVAVDAVSFEVPKGRIFGLLGPNGAGKTSLIRIITTITRADAGQVYLDGEPISGRHPRYIGYLPEERGLYRRMKVGEHLLYLAGLKGMSSTQARERIHHWMEKFDITDWWDKKVQELSKGMQQKVQFISTVMHDPKLLILDEPFSGLDPINTNLIKDEINQLHQKGTSIIFSTHRMEQVEEICEDIVLINKGKNILEGSVREVKHQFKRNLYRLDYEGELPAMVRAAFPPVEEKRQYVLFQLQEGQSANVLLQKLIQAGVEVHAFNEILPSLNEIFIRQVEDNNNTYA